MKDLVILGSTGSIGTQTLQVAEKCGFKVSALAAGKNAEMLETQARKFKPKAVALFDEKKAEELKIALKDTPVKVYSGESGVCALAEIFGNTVCSSIVGIAGLKPTVSAIKAKKTVALSNKETLVTAGGLVNKLAK